MVLSRGVRRSIKGVAASVVVVLGVFGVLSMTGWAQVDAAGMSKWHVEKMTAEQQFDLFGKRYERMQRMITETQNVINSTDEWYWNDKGLDPNSGTGTDSNMPAANADNSYYLNTGRIINIPGATDERESALPIINYFKSKGWKVTDYKDEQSGGYHATATTKDGWQIRIEIQTNGVTALDVDSPEYWGDVMVLTENVSSRIAEKSVDFEQSKPGYWIPFPKWSDPIVDP